MSIFSRLFGRPEKRSASPSTWDFLRSQAEVGIDTGLAPSAALAEGLGMITACRNAIAGPVSIVRPCIYKKGPGGARAEQSDHSVARLFDRPNDSQTWPELVDMMTGHCVIRGNAYARVYRGDDGSPIALEPYHPDWISVVRLSTTGRYRYDVSLPSGGTVRLLPEEVLHLRDSSDDGIVGRSRISRARGAVVGALQADQYARSTFANGASMSGVLSHPENIGEEASERLRKSFEATYSGTSKAGRVAILEEGLRWQQISVSPDDAQALESRQFSIQEIARIFGCPGPVVNDFSGGGGAYSSVVEVNRWFIQTTIMWWVKRWEKILEHTLLTPAGRRSYEIEFDVDDLLRGDFLARMQGYRVAREIGLYSANELRKFEKANPRTDAGGDEYFAPANLQPEQTGQPIADRGGGDAAAA